MKPLFVTLGILGFTVLSTQFFRHLNVYWFPLKDSVLDKYEEKTEKEIADSQSLAELISQYENARRKVKEWEKGKSKDEIEKSRFNDDLRRDESKFRQAIQEWESRSREIIDLHFFWWIGLGCICLGLVCSYVSNRWLGAALLTVGFIEMIYWTSPLFRFTGGGTEFERLLIWKLRYTGASLVLLLGLWGYFVRKK